MLSEKFPRGQSETSQGSESKSYVCAVRIRETSSIRQCSEERIYVFGLWRLQSLRRNPMFLLYEKIITKY